MAFFKLAIVAAAAAPAVAYAGRRQDRRLGTDDVDYAAGRPISTCAASFEWIQDNVVNHNLFHTGVDIDAEGGCVRYPSIFDDEGFAWRPVDPNVCFCDNFCDANDDCCVDFCAACEAFPDPGLDITFFNATINGSALDDSAVVATYEAGPSHQFPWSGRLQTTGDPQQFFFPEQPLCIPQDPVDPNENGVCNVDVPFATFDYEFPWIQYADSVAAGRFEGGNWSDDGRPLQWLMSVEAIDDTTVLPWALSGLNALPDAECDGTPLVSNTDTATDIRYAQSTNPCDWIPYIANGWSELPKCVVAPAIGRHRANARHLKAIDMGMQVNQDCCRDCAPDNAVQYARTTMILDETAHPTGWAGVIKFVGNDAAVIWKDGVRVYQEEVCSAATSGLAVEIPFYLAPGKNVIVVKARNHGQEMKEKNQGFFMKFPLNIIDDIIISIEKPEGAPPAPDVPGGIGGGLNRSRREL